MCCAWFSVSVCACRTCACKCLCCLGVPVHVCAQVGCVCYPKSGRRPHQATLSPMTSPIAPLSTSLLSFPWPPLQNLTSSPSLTTPAPQPASFPLTPLSSASKGSCENPKPSMAPHSHLGGQVFMLPCPLGWLCLLIPVPSHPATCHEESLPTPPPAVPWGGAWSSGSVACLHGKQGPLHSR